MPTKILMPALSPTMTEGNISNWVAKEGQKIKSGDVLLEIETDKAIMEFESNDNGVLGKILVPSKTENVSVGSVIAVLLKDGESKKDLEEFISKIKSTTTPQPNKSQEDLTKVLKKEIATEQDLVPNVDDSYSKMPLEGRLERSSLGAKVSPLAARIAQMRGIDVSGIYGTGTGGRVVKRDVEQKSAQPSGLGVEKMGRITNFGTTTLQMSQMRKVIARRLQESKSTVPHFYLSTECNASKMLRNREEINDFLKTKEGGMKISVNDLIIKTVACSLKKHPGVNKFLSNDTVVQKSSVDISIAISIEGGLLAPVLFDADLKSILSISKEVKDMASRSRSGKIKPDELVGGSVSISNLGMFGIEEFFAIINPPQSCILAIGAATQKPWVENGNIIIADIIKLGLSVDHRIVDGAEAAAFLAEIKSIIESPTQLLM